MEEDREGVEGGTKREWERREWRAEVGGGWEGWKRDGGYVDLRVEVEV